MKKIIITICITILLSGTLLVTSYADEFKWSALYSQWPWVETLVNEGKSDEEIKSEIRSSVQPSMAIHMFNLASSAAKEDTSSETPTETEDYNSDERIEEIKRQLEELRIDYDSLADKFNLYELQNIQLSDKFDIFILSLADFKQFFVDTFYKDSDLSNDSVFKINQDNLSELQKNVLLSNEYLNNIYHKMFRSNSELDDYLYEDDEFTLIEQIELMQNNITDSLTATNEKTLEELNITLNRTNTFLSYLMISLVVMVSVLLAFWIGKLIHNILSRNVY